jgi:CHAD domain-containing protein
MREEPAAEPEPRDPWRKVRKLALRQLDRFMSLEPQVLRGDDPDAIHDIRVASRRLQQVLDLLYPTPSPAEIRKLRRRIRRSRRALGEVRNCDVQLARVDRILASKRATRREIWEAVRHYLLQRRAKNFEKSARKLSRLNLAVFYVRLKDVLAPNDNDRPLHGDRHHQDPRAQRSEEFHQRVSESLERVWRAFDAQVGQSHRDPQAGVIHAVRIAAKRLRYLIEVIHEFGVPGSKNALAWLRGLQEHLGNWHDLEVLEQMMIEMVARPEFLRDHLETAMGVEKLILKTRSGKVTFRQKYFGMTRDAEGYQQVNGWVASLLASPAAFVPVEN